MILRFVAPIVIFAVSYSGFLIWSTPAAWLAARIRPELTQVHVELSAISGTAWRGSADLTLRGIDLGRLRWDTAPWSLLHGAVDAQIRLKGPDIDARAHVQAEHRGTLLTDVKGEAGLALMATLTGLPTALDGRLTAALDQIRFGDSGSLDSARGNIVAHDARLPQLGVSIGTLTLTLQNQNGLIDGRLSNSGGDLDLGGTLQLTPAGAYELHTTLKPHPGRNRLTDGLAAFLGSPDAQARYHFDASGQLAH